MHAVFFFYEEVGVLLFTADSKIVSEITIQTIYETSSYEYVFIKEIGCTGLPIELPLEPKEHIVCL